MEVCAAADLRRADVVRFDHARKTYAVYRDEDGKLFATDGLCTHGNTHLSDGLVKGGIIECPKHNGRFHLIDGSPARAPICRGLATYPVAERDGRIFVDVVHAGGVGARAHTTFRFRVVSNRSVATFIKELVLEPEGGDDAMAFAPGDYLQLDIPAYDSIRFQRLRYSRAVRDGVEEPARLRSGGAEPAAGKAATTIRWPAIRARSGNCASMCALPRRRRDRTARRAWDRVTYSA